MKTDITMHNDSELSDIFSNDEGLWEMACATGDVNELLEVAKELFIFNDEQSAEFEQDFYNGVFDE